MSTQPFIEPFSPILGFLQTNSAIFQWLGILILLVVLTKLFEQTWLFYRQSLFKNAIEWALLEIKIPREVMRTPRAMEQFFMNLYALRNVPGNFAEKYIDGEVTLWWSLEIVSFGGEIHFYIRTPKKHKKMTEAGLYAQYPNAEVIEINKEYLDLLPKQTKEIYQKGYDIFGSEFILRQPDFYPITTYERFELSKEEMSIDPLSALLEVLANIHKEETVFIQILIRPAGPEWQEAGKKFVDKLIGRETKTKVPSKDTLGDIARNVFMSPVEHPKWAEKDGIKEEKMDLTMWKLTPGEKEIVEAIERDIAKPSFETVVRFLYYAPIPIFNVNFAIKSPLGALNQYASQNLNSFGINWRVATRSRWIYFPYFFVKKRVEARKQRLLYNFRNRKMPEELKLGSAVTSHPFNFNFKSKSCILSTAELATLYHIPAEQVLTAPHIKRAESKRMGPPAGLQIFTEEE